MLYVKMDAHQERRNQKQFSFVWKQNKQQQKTKTCSQTIFQAD